MTCSQIDCPRVPAARGLCQACYQKWRRGTLPGWPEFQPAQVCRRPGWSRGDHVRWHKYRITPEEFRAMSQVCEICGSEDDLCVDHCHETGAVRGRLCAPCNKGLGAFRDDPARLEEALKYLRRDPS